MFREAVAALDTLADGPDKRTPWLTERQLDELESQLFRQPQRTLLEANQAVRELLLKAQVDVNEATGEADSEASSAACGTRTNITPPCHRRR